MSTFQHLQRDKYGDGGIYALYPFDSPLVRRKGVFKLVLLSTLTDVYINTILVVPQVFMLLPT